MVKAIWKGATPAENETTEVADGNHCFPAQSVSSEYPAPGRRYPARGQARLRPHRPKDLELLARNPTDALRRGREAHVHLGVARR